MADLPQMQKTIDANGRSSAAVSMHILRRTAFTTPGWNTATAPREPWERL